MTDIHLEDMRVTRAGRDVLMISALHVRAGRTTAVLGPNAAGKTSLLRVIAGLDRPSDGRVLVGGDLADVRRHSVAYMFQEDVFLRRTLLDNVTIALAIRGVSREDAQRRATDALRLVGVDHLATRRADRISGGEARRASLARALCLAAPVLLLDEPMTGLDGSAYVRLRDELADIVGRSAATTVIVTHNREEALRLCDDLVVLVAGEVVAAGAKHDVVINPRRVDVAEVLGYSVLNLNGRRIAIAESALQFGDGANGFTVRVEGSADLVHEWDVTGAFQGSRLHIRVPRQQPAPAVGDAIPVHARAIYEVS